MTALSSTASLCSSDQLLTSAEGGQPLVIPDKTTPPPPSRPPADIAVLGVLNRNLWDTLVGATKAPRSQPWLGPDNQRGPSSLFKGESESL